MRMTFPRLYVVALTLAVLLGAAYVIARVLKSLGI